MDITESAIESFLRTIAQTRRNEGSDGEAPLAQSTARTTRTSGTPKGLSDRASQLAESTGSLFLKAILAYKAMEYEDALILFKKLLRKDPSRRQIYGMLGTTFFQNGMLSEAIEVFELLKTIEPDDPSVHENLGYIYCAKGNFEAAAREWQLLPEQSPGKAGLARKLDDAARRSADLDPDNDPQKKRLKLLIDGIGYYRKRNYELAIRAFKLASLLMPESTAYSLLGNAYFRNEMIAESVQAYENAISFDGKNIFAFESLGQVYSRQGAVDQAIETWEKILQIDPNRSDIVKRIDDLITEYK
jgi:tetratricopeptide (TPR) repeat protein